MVNNSKKIFFKVIIVTLIMHINICNAFHFFDYFLSCWPFRNTQEVSITHEHMVKSNISLTISNTRGNITIKTWNQNKILVETVIKGSESELRNAFIEPVYEDSHVLFKTVHASKKDIGLCLVNYHILIPATARLALVTTDFGSVTLYDIKQPARVVIEEGDIVAHNILSSLNATTQIGSIEISVVGLIENSKILAFTKKGNISMMLSSKVNAHLIAMTHKGLISSDVPITIEPVTMKINNKTLSALKKEIKGNLGKGCNNNNIKLHTNIGSIKLTNCV